MHFKVDIRYSGQVSLWLSRSIKIIKGNVGKMNIINRAFSIELPKISLSIVNRTQLYFTVWSDANINLDLLEYGNKLYFIFSRAP